MEFTIGEHVIVEKWGDCSDGFGFGWIIDSVITEDGRSLYFVENTTSSDDHETVWLEENEIVSLKL